jgi:hypothetical protein
VTAYAIKAFIVVIKVKEGPNLVFLKGESGIPEIFFPLCAGRRKAI